MVEQNIKEKVKEIYEVLPKLNDRRCGYRTCGEFARAVVKGEAPCYGCISGGYAVARKVCNIMGEKVPDKEQVSFEYNKTVGFAGRGRARGYRNLYYAAGLPYSRRYKSDLSTRIGVAGGYNYYRNIYRNQRMDADQEKIILKQQADFIGKQLNDIKKRIRELEKNRKK